MSHRLKVIAQIRTRTTSPLITLNMMAHSYGYSKAMGYRWTLGYSLKNKMFYMWYGFTPLAKRVSWHVEGIIGLDQICPLTKPKKQISTADFTYVKQNGLYKFDTTSVFENNEEFQNFLCDVIGIVLSDKNYVDVRYDIGLRRYL